VEQLVTTGLRRIGKIHRKPGKKLISNGMGSELLCKSMVKTLVVTDIHLHTPRPGYLDAQVECLQKIFEEANPSKMIIMGDIFMSRKPNPSVLLGFKRFLDSSDCDEIYVMRGNHDSENKSDNGVTALSVFHDPDRGRHVITHTTTKDEWTFIPHYEDENRIREDLKAAPKNNIVFGHFGYIGCVGTVRLDEIPFGLDVEEFPNTTYLGHIHRFKQTGDVTILGTQYSTNFGEAEKDSYYMLLDDDDNPSFHEVKHGPRHIVCNLSELPDVLKRVDDPNYFTHLRVFVEKLTEDNSVTLASDIAGKCDAAQIDIKYNPVFSEGGSTFRPSRKLFSLNEAIVDEYIDHSGTAIAKEDLLEGYRLLDEDS